MATTIWQRGFEPIKKILPEAVWSPLRGLATGLLTPIRFSGQTGHWRSSLRRAACTASGEPLPWYTYPAIDFLACREFSKCRILEFGGGQSTLWWASRAMAVVTVEEDSDWHRTLQQQVPGNVVLHHVPADIATRSISAVVDVLGHSGERKFEVIVVDGHLRKELALLAFDYLANNGAIVLDNAEGYGFYEALRYLECRRIDFYGFAPGVAMRHCTSLVYRGDCFLLKPAIPIHQIES